MKTSQDVLETSQQMGHRAGVATLANTGNHEDRSQPTASLGAADVMTVSDVAEFLHIPVSTVYELTRRGEPPARRVGRAWRFLRPRLEEFLWGSQASARTRFGVGLGRLQHGSAWSVMPAAVGLVGAWSIWASAAPWDGWRRSVSDGCGPRTWGAVRRDG